MSKQPPDRPRRRAASGPRKWNRPALIAVGGLVVAAAVSTGFALAGGRGTGASLSSGVTAPAKVLVTAAATSSSSSDPAPASDPASSPSRSLASDPASSRPSPSSSAPWLSANCPSKLVSWRSTGAGGQLQVVVTDITIASQAAESLEGDLKAGKVPPSAVTALRSAATSLRSGTAAAGKNLIPGCVSGAHQAEVTGLADLGSAAAGFGRAVRETGSGDYGTARRSIRTAIAALQSGSADMAKTTVDLNRYGTK